MRQTGREPDHVADIVELASDDRWPELLACREAWRVDLRRNPDLAPLVAHCEYLLCLHGPAPLAASVLSDNLGRSDFGPLAEVAAQHHTWADLGSRLASKVAAAFAHERSFRGENVAGIEPITLADGLGMGHQIFDWEPPYAVADYRRDHARFPSPELPPIGSIVRLPVGGEVIGDPHVVDAVKELLRPWLAHPGVQAQVVTAEGDHLSAIAAFELNRARIKPVDFSTVLAMLTRVGAGGGAFGARRGNAAGRVAAWWLASAFAGVSEDWPLSGTDMREVGNDLSWYLWEPDHPPLGPSFRLAAHDDVEELGFALEATGLR